MRLCSTEFVIRNASSVHRVIMLRLDSGSMEIFKLLESTIPNVQPGHSRTKDLRRDQLLDNYDEAILSLQTLIKAKESEIVYKRDLIDVLDKCKSKCDNKMMSATQNYQLAKKHAPESLLKEISSKRSAESHTSTSSTTAVPTSTNVTPSGLNLTPTSSHQQQQATPQLKNSELDIPLPSENMDNRSSLDRRLSEFLKTFPNLTQAGLATPTSNNNNIKPMPGYYTQQPPPPPISSAPPLMAMMRFPPPPIIAPPNSHPNLTVLTQQHVGENHDMADMDLSDYDESSNTGGVALGPPMSGPATEGGADLLPMIASAVQQGAGGKHHVKQEFPAQQPQTSYGGGGSQQYNNSMPFAPRLNPLPFDPSIMEPRLGGSSSSSGGSRGDKHSHGDRTVHRHSSSSGSSSGARHTPEKNKYSTSSHSSNRSKRR